MKIKPMLPLEFLKECFEIDETSPTFLKWKIRPRNHFESEGIWKNFISQYSGKSAGRFKPSNEYLEINFNGERWLGHRILYCLYNNTIDIDNFLIDHKDGNRLNNSPENLRIATPSQNTCNQTKICKNQSGLRGVRINCNRFCSNLIHCHKNINLGNYLNLDSAGFAYNQACIFLRGEFCGPLNPIYNLTEEEKEEITLKVKERIRKYTGIVIP